MNPARRAPSPVHSATVAWPLPGYVDSRRMPPLFESAPPRTDPPTNVDVQECNHMRSPLLSPVIRRPSLLLRGRETDADLKG